MYRSEGTRTRNLRQTCTLPARSTIAAVAGVHPDAFSMGSDVPFNVLRRAARRPAPPRQGPQKSTRGPTQHSAAAFRGGNVVLDGTRGQDERPRPRAQTPPSD